MLYLFYRYRFPKRSTLELNNKQIGLRILILPEYSSLEPAPKVWKPMSMSKNTDLLFVAENFKVGLLRNSDCF